MKMSSRPPILVIRAEPGASETAGRLKEMGLTPVVSPALGLSRTDATVPDLSAFEGLIFTSANGVRFLIEACGPIPLPAWCVGPATASEALREGFSPVYQSSGDAHDLAHYIAHHWDEDRPRSLLHVANSAAKGIVKEALEAEGFTVTFAPLYEATHAAALSAPAKSALTSGEPVICLIHSAKGAEAFQSLADGIDLSSVTFVAISEQAARPVRSVAGAAIFIASHPDEPHLMDALQGVLAAR
jgi:uroporphyrinogen-III synthase